MAYRTVLFDCDSTLSSIEGIDELAHEHRAEITPLTDAAMRGEIPLESVYARRLEIIRPSAREMARVGELYIEHLVAGAREVVAALQDAGVDVRIISGGLRPAVLVAARALGVGDESVFAVDAYFDEQGDYRGFDEASPLARAGGKTSLIASWSSIPRPVMLVGDGATDAEARHVVDTFVAFAGVAERASVVAVASHVVRAPSLLPVLALALADAPSQDPRTRALVERGLALLR
ncbi:MAG: HAD-IB family phosphatase [Gemmatimonadaceae bacterium]